MSERFENVQVVRDGLRKVDYLADDGIAGVVFLAEQSTPVNRKVALKVIKPGMGAPTCIGSAGSAFARALLLLWMERS